MQLLTHSRISSFKRCRREHWYKYERALRPVSDSHALSFGRLFHEGLDLLRTEGIDVASNHVLSAEVSCEVWNRFDPYTVDELLRGYKYYWGTMSDIHHFLESEIAFEIPLLNPDTGQPSRTFMLAGKIDGICVLKTGRIGCHETKTTSDDPNSERYWRRLLMDQQMSLYMIASQAWGTEVGYYDVIRKPAMKPALATPVESRKYKKDGTLYANQRDTDETPSEWANRLRDDICSRPDFYYARREVPRLQQDLDEFRYELLDIAKDLRAAQINNRWYRTPGRQTCDNCPYFNLCSGLQPWDGESAPEGFQIVSDIHPELERTNDAATDGQTENASSESA